VLSTLRAEGEIGSATGVQDEAQRARRKEQLAQWRRQKVEEEEKAAVTTLHSHLLTPTFVNTNLPNCRIRAPTSPTGSERAAVSGGAGEVTSSRDGSWSSMCAWLLSSLCSTTVCVSVRISGEEKAE